MTRVIHTGDTHLGYRQYHLEARRNDFLAAFRRVVDDAVEADVDAVVHAGDLFHDRRPDLPDIIGALSVLRELADADIPFLAVVGNHETKRDAQWLDLFESLDLATRLGRDPVTIGDTAFYGLDFVPRSQREDIEYTFESHDVDHAALVAHGLFEPLVPDYGNVEWDAREVLDAANVAFDAMLLGDEHTPERTEIGDTWVTYCGSTERTSTNEREERGYNVVEFDDRAHITRRALPTRNFEFIDVNLAEGEGIDRVREQVSQHELTNAVAVVSIEGGGESLAPGRIEEYVREQGALAARVNDRRDMATEERDLDVDFADPDEAVRKRVRELGLSSAARDLDETIRASKVADTNVADTVEDHVRDLVNNADSDIFRTAPNEPAAEDETIAERVDGNAKEDGVAEETAPSPSEEIVNPPPDGENGSPSEPSDAEDGEPGSTAEPADSQDDAAAADGGNASGEDDGQASMEEFL